MRRSSLIVTAAIVSALPITAGAVTRHDGIFLAGGSVALPAFYASEVEFNVEESAILARPLAEMGGGRRGSTTFRFQLESVAVPLPVSALMLLAAFAGLAFLSHRRISALSWSTGGDAESFTGFPRPASR